jgi:hypothetical protein
MEQEQQKESKKETRRPAVTTEEPNPVATPIKPNSNLNALGILVILFTIGYFFVYRSQFADKTDEQVIRSRSLAAFIPGMISAVILDFRLPSVQKNYEEIKLRVTGSLIRLGLTPPATPRSSSTSSYSASPTSEARGITSSNNLGSTTSPEFFFNQNTNLKGSIATPETPLMPNTQGSSADSVKIKPYPREIYSKWINRFRLALTPYLLTLLVLNMIEINKKGFDKGDELYIDLVLPTIGLVLNFSQFLSTGKATETLPYFLEKPYDLLARYSDTLGTLTEYFLRQFQILPAEAMKMIAAAGVAFSWNETLASLKADKNQAAVIPKQYLNAYPDYGAPSTKQVILSALLFGGLYSVSTWDLYQHPPYLREALSSWVMASAGSYALYNLFKSNIIEYLSRGYLKPLPQKFHYFYNRLHNLMSVFLGNTAKEYFYFPLLEGVIAGPSKTHTLRDSKERREAARKIAIFLTRKLNGTPEPIIEFLKNQQGKPNEYIEQLIKDKQMWRRFFDALCFSPSILLAINLARDEDKHTIIRNAMSSAMMIFTIFMRNYYLPKHRPSEYSLESMSVFQQFFYGTDEPLWNYLCTVAFSIQSREEYNESWADTIRSVFFNFVVLPNLVVKAAYKHFQYGGVQTYVPTQQEIDNFLILIDPEKFTQWTTEHQREKLVVSYHLIQFVLINCIPKLSRMRKSSQVADLTNPIEEKGESRLNSRRPSTGSAPPSPQKETKETKETNELGSVVLLTIPESLKSPPSPTNIPGTFFAKHGYDDKLTIAADSKADEERAEARSDISSEKATARAAIGQELGLADIAYKLVGTKS